MNFLLSLLMILIWMVEPATAADVVLNWNVNTESDLAGYKIYQSTISGQYGAPVATLGKVTTSTLVLPQLTVDATYFFVITAYDLSGNESGKSAEVNKLVAGIPLPPSLPSPTNFRYEDGAMKWDAMPQAAGGYYLRVHEMGTPYDPCSAMLYCNEGVNTLMNASKVLPFKPNTLYDSWVHSVAADGTFGIAAGTQFTTPAQIYTASAVVIGDPLTGAWAVEASTNAPAPYAMDVYVNGVYDHTEGSAPWCSWGNQTLAACDQVVKAEGTYLVEFRVMVNAMEVARASVSVVVPNMAPAPPSGLTAQ